MSLEEGFVVSLTYRGLTFCLYIGQSHINLRGYGYTDISSDYHFSFNITHYYQFANFVS